MRWKWERKGGKYKRGKCKEGREEGKIKERREVGGGREGGKN